jgi:hypothetical protein
MGENKANVLQYKLLVCRIFYDSIFRKLICPSIVASCLQSRGWVRWADDPSLKWTKIQGG